MCAGLPAGASFLKSFGISTKEERAMAVTMMSQDLEAGFSFAPPQEVCAISELCRSDQPEVMEFLSARPLHTVFMTGLIRDNGMLSPQNRGSFYGSRNRLGQLEGIALIGHATMVKRIPRIHWSVWPG
jgi:hypothetical protein